MTKTEVPTLSIVFEQFSDERSASNPLQITSNTAIYQHLSVPREKESSLCSLIPLDDTKDLVDQICFVLFRLFGDFRQGY